jgi:DNA-directed RNA polymerase specialized sigma24 family protein
VVPHGAFRFLPLDIREDNLVCNSGTVKRKNILAQLAGRSIGVEQDVFSSERLERAFSLMTDFEKELILMRYMEGFTWGEIANYLGMATREVKAIIKHAILRVRLHEAHVL